MGLPVPTNTLPREVNVPMVPQHGTVGRTRTLSIPISRPHPYRCQLRRSGEPLGFRDSAESRILPALSEVLGMESEGPGQLPALPHSFTHPSGFQHDLYLLTLNTSSTHHKTGCFEALDTPGDVTPGH